MNKRLFNSFGGENTYTICPELDELLMDFSKKVVECAIKNNLDIRDVENVSYQYMQDQILEHILTLKQLEYQNKKGAYL